MFELVTRAGHPDFLDLPFDQPLAEWAVDHLVDVARGVSRHVVRFVSYGAAVYALKEIPAHLAHNEYDLLRQLEGKGVPAVEAVGVVTRPEQDALLITRHLSYSMPYRYLFRGRTTAAQRRRLLDAMALLLVRIHLEGFLWGDCSLSNTLFRRDAGALSAYLVDAETGRLQEQLSDGQRAWDLDIAVENCAGELLDLQMGRRLPDDVDPLSVAEDVRSRYESLWTDLTRVEVFGPDDRHRIAARLRRLNDLGFDVEEYAVRAEVGGRRLQLIPRVMELGHHRRRLQQLTGLDVGENQARRLLLDIDSHRADLAGMADPASGGPVARVPDALAAYHWLYDVYAPTLAAIPADLRAKLADAELYHQVLEHRWYLSEQAGHDVGTAAAVASYADSVLRDAPTEDTLLPTGDDTASLSLRDLERLRSGTSRSSSGATAASGSVVPSAATEATPLRGTTSSGGAAAEPVVG